MHVAESGTQTEADPITAIRRHPLVVLFHTLVFAAIGVVFALGQPDSFSAKAGLVVEDARASTLFSSRSSNADRYVADQVAILESRVVAERASELLTAEGSAVAISVEDFLDGTSVTYDEDSNFVTIEFFSDTASKAQAGADAIGLAYETVVAEALAEDAEQAVAELDEAIDAAVLEIDTLQSQIEGLPAEDDARVELDNQLALLRELTLLRSQIEVDARLAGNGVAFLAPADPGESRAISIFSVVVLMSALGALIGAAVAYWLGQRLRDYFENRLAPSSILEAPLLAEIPSIAPATSTGTDEPSLLPILDDPESAQAEAFRVLVGGLVQRLDEKQNAGGATQGLTLAVCSSTLGEGSTVVAVNTAIAASQAGLGVALIDGDLGTQSASSLLAGFSPDSEPPGLTDLIQSQDKNQQESIVEIKARTAGSIYVVGRGQGDMTATEVFGSRRTSRVLSDLENEYDLVIVDVPPLLQVAYATAAVQKANQALVVLRHKSSVENLQELRYRLDVIGVKALGYVYTDSPPRRNRDAVAGGGRAFDVLGHQARDGTVDSSPPDNAETNDNTDTPDTPDTPGTPDTPDTPDTTDTTDTPDTTRKPSRPRRRRKPSS